VVNFKRETRKLCIAQLKEGVPALSLCEETTSLPCVSQGNKTLHVTRDPWGHLPDRDVTFIWWGKTWKEVYEFVKDKIAARTRRTNLPEDVESILEQTIKEVISGMSSDVYASWKWMCAFHTPSITLTLSSRSLSANLCYLWLYPDKMVVQGSSLEQLKIKWSGGLSHPDFTPEKFAIYARKIIKAEKEYRKAKARFQKRTDEITKDFTG
jgi:hypothetical protein